MQANVRRAAVAAWVVFVAVVCARTVLRPLSGSIYPTYATAGAEFAAGRPLYDVPHPNTDNYRYSPVVAAGFVPFAELPLGIGGAAWRLLSVAVFLTGLAAWARRLWPGAPMPAAFLLAMPLCFHSVSNGQANTCVVGLMLWAAAGCAAGRWAAGAALLAGAVLFKGYPLALGMLLALAAPVRFGLPLAAAVAAGLALPYALQSPDYVTAQYRHWFDNLTRDDRTGFALHAGYQDFHMLLRVVGVNVPRGPYFLVQAGAGAAAAAVLVWQLWRGVARREVVGNALALGLCWMTLFGPSTETATFILLAPLLPRELLDRATRPAWARAAAFAGAGLFALALVAIALPHAVHRPVVALGVQPLAALLLSASVVQRVLATRADEPVAALADAPARRAA